MTRLRHRQAGLSLVELMIAVTLSLILGLGIIQIFSSSKQTSRVQNALARLQENARFALDILSRDIRMAGQLGCNSNAHITDSSNDTLAAFNDGITGYDYTTSMNINLTADGGNLNGVIDGTDVIVVAAAAANTIPVASSTPTAVTVASAGALADIEAGEPMIISDCDSADLFIAGDRAPFSSALPVKDAELSKVYSDTAELARLNYTAYYLRADNDNDGARNLYRSYVNNFGGNTGITTEPLLAGVEDLQILYGQDVNGDGGSIRYGSSDLLVDPSRDEVDWSRVVSVRIHLLLATTEDNLAAEPEPRRYWFMGDLNTAADRRLYRSFTTTIQLRNQGLGS